MVDLSIEVPDGWLESEERCGYCVTRETKEIWAVLLDLYSEFARVCDAHGIEYFATYGTALGAVRHGGFIPWDDDFDVMMLREEYNKLCDLAKEFSFPYFFQTVETDEGYALTHAQLRRCDTTGVLAFNLDYRREFNQGIFLDIFPLDAIPDDERKARRQMRRVHLLRVLTSKSLRHGDDWLRRSHSAKAMIAHPALAIFSKIYPWRKLIALDMRQQNAYNGDDTSRLCNFTVKPGDVRSRRFRDDLRSVVMMDFEFLRVPVPAGYDHALRCLYGDYEKYVIGGSAHGEVVFDVDTPYDIWLDAYFGEHSFSCLKDQR